MSGGVEFDRIAPVYDETRRPPFEEEVDALVELLAGSRSVLDAGIGTGRFALPLKARQFEIIGADLSRGMMQRARAKGIRALVRADLHHLPLRNKSVDAAFMAHVLQLLPDPRAVLGELGRVSRLVVVLQLPEWTERDGTAGPWRQRRQRYRELAAELGYPLAERGKRYHHTLDQLSAIATPRAVRVVTGPVPTPAEREERISRWTALAMGGNQLPPEVHAEIIRRMRAERPVDPSAGMRPREARFVAWDAASLESKPS